jgi:gamma-glutamyltranspeptidase / glutathione hydrolase
MTPTIVEKEGKLFLFEESPGGSTIPTSVFQVIINVIDFGIMPHTSNRKHQCNYDHV